MKLSEIPIYVPKPGQPGYVELTHGYVKSRPDDPKPTAIQDGCSRCGYLFAEYKTCPLIVPFDTCFSDEACRSFKLDKRLKKNK